MELIQIYPDRTATLLKFNARVAYFVHGVWLSFNATCTRYLIDHGYTVWKFLRAGKAEMKMIDREAGSDMDGLQCRFTSLEVTPPGNLSSHTASTSSREERVTALKEAKRSILAQLRKCSKRWFQGFFERRKGLGILF